MRHADFLLKKIAESGLRIFSMNDLKTILTGTIIKESYLPKLVHKLIQNGLLRPLFRGMYALPNSLLAGPPLHPYEVVNHIVSPSTICCWSAMSIHNLTDQVLRDVYILAPKGQTEKNSSQYKYKVEEVNYLIIRVKPEYFFGIEKRFINESVISVTDLERTLIDGLVRPQYCGGFYEVLEAFRVAQDKLDIKKTMDYAAKFGPLTSKRLGWVLEQLNIYPKERELLKKIPYSSFHKIDVSRPNTGEWIRPWNLRKNI